MFDVLPPKVNSTDTLTTEDGRVRVATRKQAGADSRRIVPSNHAVTSRVKALGMVYTPQSFSSLDHA